MKHNIQSKIIFLTINLLFLTNSLQSAAAGSAAAQPMRLTLQSDVPAELITGANKFMNSSTEAVGSITQTVIRTSNKGYDTLVEASDAIKSVQSDIAYAKTNLGPELKSTMVKTLNDEVIPVLGNTITGIFKKILPASIVAAGAIFAAYFGLRDLQNGTKNTFRGFSRERNANKKLKAIDESTEPLFKDPAVRKKYIDRADDARQMRNEGLQDMAWGGTAIAISFACLYVTKELLKDQVAL